VLPDYAAVIRHLATLSTLVGVLVAGCGGAAGIGSSTHLPTPPAATAGIGVPPVVTRACDRARLRVRFPFLCPTSWPRTESHRPAQLRWITLTRDVYLLNAINGPDDRTPHVFHLLVGGQRRPFGADWRTIDPGLRITTRLIRIPIRGGGSFVQSRPAERIGTTTVHGTRALLLREPPYPAGGLHGGHILVLWDQGGHGYVVSVHGTGMTPHAVIETAVALARSAHSSQHSARRHSL
jgi:hypothetical protein